MKLLGVDIGYTNMGLVMATCDGPRITIDYIKKVDLGEYKYIGKTNDTAIIISLFLSDYDHLFKEADTVLIERQPPAGLTNIESLLHYIYMDKVVLISPLSVHRHFGMSHLDYDQRKERSISIAGKYINDIPYERQHDIADALCMIIHYNFKASVHSFDSFRFTKTRVMDRIMDSSSV